MYKALRNGIRSIHATSASISAFPLKVQFQL
jgi:hypothetical protein